MAQSVEHMLGKHEVPGPNPGSSSSSVYGNRIFPVAVFCFLRAVQERRQPVRPASGAPPVPAPDAGVSLTRWLRHGLVAADERELSAFFVKRPGEKLQKPRGGENRQGVRYKCPTCRILSMSAAEIDSLRRFPVFPEPFQEEGHNENCGRFSLPRPAPRPFRRRTREESRRGGEDSRKRRGKSSGLGIPREKGGRPAHSGTGCSGKGRAGYKRAPVCCKRTVPDASAGKKQAPGRLQKDGAGVKSRKNQ